MMHLFDSHCHLQNAKFASDREDAIARAREAGVARILNLATCLEDAGEVVALAHAHEECLAAVGVHPSDIECWSKDTEDGLMAIARDPAVVVWGEIGLDYFHKPFDRDAQRKIFRRQLAIARELRLPVSMHCRESNDDLIADLRTEKGTEIGGVAHCFDGTREHAAAYIDLGFALGVGGSSTFPRAEGLRAILRDVGTEHLLLETDSPYLAPQARRGKRNEPAFVAMTAEALAQTLEIDLEELKDACWRNTVRAFRLNADATARASV